MDIKVLGIDLGKAVRSHAGLDKAGAVVFRKRLQRHRLLDFLIPLPPCLVAMEACGGVHHIGRFCLEKGHEPRLMSPLYFRPYVKVYKNDDRDAEAIAEAATRPTVSFVAIKSEEQLDLQALHRARERLVSDRTRLINQGRGFLMERGIRVGTGRHVFQKELARLAAEGASDLSTRMRLLVTDIQRRPALPLRKGARRLIGRTNGGMNTKLHAICDSEGRPIDLFVMAAQVSDYIGARAARWSVKRQMATPG
ncbi:IS110 family transposase [Thioclava sp. JE_KL1]|uniref:IS110 family transposase n=1 Tax=Thioclava sp. JE_KL1 TaxID=2651187 RepID=UPI001562D39B|nr:IS110 family transposase [Thioclava sp. JE_KL1]